MRGGRLTLAYVWMAATLGMLGAPTARAAENATTLLDRIGVTRGIAVVPGDLECKLALDLVRASDLIVYVQLPRPEETEAARRAADSAGVYGTRVYVEKGSLDRIHLADNIADVLIAVGDAASQIPQAEVMRVLCPRGKALLGDRQITKPLPAGTDDWSHPYHGPDNNPQSNDQLARAPYMTQFLAEPRYGPSPQVAVASAGRVFKAFGNVAWHKREEPYLNTLVAFNGYNGAILWKRELPPGYMIHRNTIIATPSTLYLGDDKSCKLLDAATGKLTGEIAPPLDVAGGTFWKWMALEDGVLYALIGEQEQKDPVVRWDRKQHGWPWDGISKGYNQPEQPWGFGRTVIAIDPATKEVLWHHHEDEPIDGRAACMKNGRIYVFGFGSFLACLDARNGEEVWRMTKDNAPELFASLGKYLTRQSWQTNWRTVAYLKCSDKALYFAGPQVGKLLAVSAADGSILWENPYDNFQLILRDDGLYGISGPWGNNVSKKFDPLTGKVLADLPTGRRGCTRPTGSIDSILHRAMGGSVRFDLAGNTRRWISPMRPSCHDGVTIANGLLYWWPWVCDCQLQLHGVVCLGPAGDFDFTPPVDASQRLERGPGTLAKTAKLPESPADWPTFRANNKATAVSKATVPRAVTRGWSFKPASATGSRPTAPVAVGGMVFVSGSDGIVRAIDAATGAAKWTAYTGGAVQFPPTVWRSRVLVGSGDGWVYAFEAQTGWLIWRFRAAPAERKIPVYGTLLSTWPVGSGVLVDDDGTAYVAAGIVNYDGTYLYALDAATGELKWENDTSGHLDPDAHTGVSVQGHLLLDKDKLYLAGGTAVSPAVYDASNGKCLNDPEQLRQCASIAPRGWELSLIGDHVVAVGKPLYTDPKYPVYDDTVFRKMFHAATGDRDIVWLDNSKIMCFKSIDRQTLSNCVRKSREPNYRVKTWGEFKIPDKPLWERDCKGSVAMAVSNNAVLVADSSQLLALDLQDGKPLWTQPLPAAPIPWGLAVDRDGRVVVSLENGGIVCLAPGA